ncbi:MAG: hypothetical protein V3U76_16905 [Granulosicoccus sp.]
MKAVHRKMHRGLWMLLLPLLLALVVFGANTKHDSMPVNNEVPGLDGSQAPPLEHRVLP